MYAQFELISEQGKTPKYRLTAVCRWVDELKAFVGKDGYISLYLQKKREQQPTDAPAMFLQAKGSYNLTGIKNFYRDGKPSGIAYGYPYRSVTYGGKKPMPNPLVNYVEDGFLFLFHYDNNSVPKCFEMLWLCDSRQMITQHCKSLEMGSYDEELKKCRADAIPYNKG